ncbi:MULTISPECIES: hypothetical protein [Pseudomonas]|uniref:hypothetical protein n=1 Tax=Pseudomonas TaxID=286 RepID=UPI000D0091F8|nr:MULTISPECIES: hypothetical protein [Pseudomonas]PRA46497.1 hypothetical protein CQZ98_23570 [Pseudomonas sp. MYb115]QXN52429.1 hypothetical protein KW062_12120 [Pseudomonas fluorescens]WSO26766.1 hypothetical protein VUJ50_12195 [Pseudomonas fluorescens]
MQGIVIWAQNGHLLGELLKHGVRFLVVGGTAVHLHDPSRDIAGADLDLLIESSPENAKHLMCALHALQVTPNFTEAEISTPVHPRQQIKLDCWGLFTDILTTGPDTHFEDEWSGAGEAFINGHQVRFASVDLLLAMKGGTGRAKDLNDIERLEALQI